MTIPFIGQIEPFAFGMAPAGWVPCAGQLMPINQNQALFALLSMTYGGDGIRTFALPDLRGRVPVGIGGEFFSPGQRGGEEAHALSTAELPAHQHSLMADASASPTGNTPSPATVLGQSSGRVVPTGQTFTANLYAGGTPDVALNNGTIAGTGNGQPHENRMPSLALNFCIYVNTRGLFPPR